MAVLGSGVILPLPFLPPRSNHIKTRRSMLNDIFFIGTNVAADQSVLFSALQVMPCGGKMGRVRIGMLAPTAHDVLERLSICISHLSGRPTDAMPSFRVRLLRSTSNHRVWIRSGQVHFVMPGCMVDRERTPRTLGSGSITLSEVRVPAEARPVVDALQYNTNTPRRA